MNAWGARTGECGAPKMTCITVTGGLASLAEREAGGGGFPQAVHQPI